MEEHKSSNKLKNKSKGERGENLAAEFLINQGAEIVARNHISKSGKEIDIICKISNILCFTEVKYRKGKGFGNPEIAVNLSKQKSIFEAASDYLMVYPHSGEIRFDIIAVFENANEEVEINHIRDAFYPLA